MAFGSLSIGISIAPNAGMQADNPIEKDVLSYFLRSPQAADTLEGIARWRLLNEFVARNVAEAHQALSSLAAQGYLCETRRVGAETIYSLNPDRVDEARQALAEMAERMRRS